MPRGVAEALHLLLLAQQVGDRVEDEVDERERARYAGARHVTEHDGSVCSSTLLRSCWTIGADSSMPVTGTPRDTRGTATLPVPMANSRTASAGELCEPVDRGIEHLGANMPVPGVSYR
jgi:hypothetical protein